VQGGVGIELSSPDLKESSDSSAEGSHQPLDIAQANRIKNPLKSSKIVKSIQLR
jgi:hypothetical protein